MDWSIGNIVWIIIGGAIIGIIARLILPGRQNIPWWSVIIAGIVGMFVGDWLASLIYRRQGHRRLRLGPPTACNSWSAWWQCGSPPSCSAGRVRAKRPDGRSTIPGAPSRKGAGLRRAGSRSGEAIP